MSIPAGALPGTQNAESASTRLSRASCNFRLIYMKAKIAIALATRSKGWE
jgi:hypothetical protein